jgi:hypothetical protein
MTDLYVVFQMSGIQPPLHSLVLENKSAPKTKKDLDEIVRILENKYNRFRNVDITLVSWNELLGEESTETGPCDDCSTFDFSCTGKCKERI